MKTPKNHEHYVFQKCLELNRGIFTAKKLLEVLPESAVLNPAYTTKELKELWESIAGIKFIVK